MAVKIESSVFIARPVEEVFPFLLDLEKATKSDPSVESVVKTPDGPIGVGTMFRLRQRPPAIARLLGRRPESTMVYTRVESNREFEFDAKLGPLSPHMRVTFEQVTPGTRVTVRGGGEPKGPFKLLAGPLQRIGQRVWDERLARLKATLEVSSSQTSGEGSA
jgi:Polyketide cyclase / dehydrase and lipid transport